jgi:hypothetical protein
MAGSPQLRGGANYRKTGFAPAFEQRLGEAQRALLQFGSALRNGDGRIR